jgi:glycosyltransferase involved in cell wall biosynthesis
LTKSQFEDRINKYKNLSKNEVKYMEKQIDILLATYNGEKYLKQQIDSILKQTYQNFQLIIADDCSTDKTREILKEYEKKDSRIKVHYQSKNLGCTKNFEFLLKQVENEIYMLSDQDDVWLPEKIEKTYAYLQKEEADLVFGDLEIVDANLETMEPSFNDFMKLHRKIKKYLSTNRLNYLYNCVTGCTIMSKKEWIEKILPIPTKSKYLIHDYWLALMISLQGKLAYMPEKYIKYRQHDNNEVGTEKISHKFTKIKQVRELFIEVKLGIFGTYVDYPEKFPEDLQQLNKKAYQYFQMLPKKKNFNFKGWSIFHQLYKTETFLYYMENFVIMNLPWIGKFLFQIRYSILKILKKRE